MSSDTRSISPPDGTRCNGMQSSGGDNAQSVMGMGMGGGAPTNAAVKASGWLVMRLRPRSRAS